ncbi:MAG TPA: M23 family metallopeptidase [Bacteroidota bacterium]|nr:M23 family metallopeptidase [Bacteroidota bacterium]
MQKGRRHIASVVVTNTVVVLSLLLSVSFRPAGHPDALTNAAIDRAYAPFDSIRTDLTDYTWPTSARPKITSSFAEFRSSHFHAGIDIGTGNRIGALVYASRDGYVARIELSPYGYGRYLVLRHPDGFYTTYAHLSAYMDKLERAVREEQLREGKFSVEMKFQPGDFPVHKGEVVAYTGESGTGDAHLHFEIRDENFNPVNPLLFPNIRQYRDDEPPVFRRLAVTPIDEHSFVDYEFAPKVYRARYGSRTVYTVAEVIRATGSVGFSVDAMDRVNNTGYHSSVYSFEFRVDDTTVFTSRRDRFPEGETRQVGLDFEWSLWKEHRGRFQKLYVDEGNSLPFYNRLTEHDGIIAPGVYAEGLHRFEIIASDCSGNTSVLRGTFVLNHPPEVQILRLEDRGLAAYFRNGVPVASIEVGTKSLDSKSWQVREYDAHGLSSNGDTLFLPQLPQGTDIVRVTAKNTWGTKSFPVFHFVRPPSASGQASVSSEEDGTFLRLSVEAPVPFTAIPSLQVEQGYAVTSVPLRAVSVNEYEGIYKLSETFGGTSHLKAFCEVAGKRGEVFDSFTMNTISPAHGGSVKSDDGVFVVEFGPGSVFTPLHPIIERLGPLKYDVYPRDVLLRGPIRVTMQYPAEKESDDKLGLYVNNGGGWRFEETTRDRGAHVFSLRDGFTLGTFALLDDSQKPSIGRWRASTRNLTRAPIFSFSARDNLSGVDPERIVAYLNGERIIPEFDPEKRRVFYVPLDPLPRGRYTLQADISDRAGNTTHLVKTLTVYR